jgi:zinc transport system ATP-binding protein
MNNQITVIELEHVFFAYQKHLILEDVSLKVQKGEFLAIIGPNGAGKTTLLKLMLGLLKPQKGNIYLFGKPVAMWDKIKNRIGYVPQTATIDASFPINVEEFVMTGRYGILRGTMRPQKKDWQIVAKVLEEVGIAEIKHRQIGELSGGQRQKMLIARALAGEPEVLVLDEPMTAIDPESMEGIYELLKRLHQQNLTIITVSHDVGVVAQYSDNIACVNRKVVKHGRPEEVLREEVLTAMYGKEAALFHHGPIPHIVVQAESEPCFPRKKED